jgi:hypothetical protein
MRLSYQRYIYLFFYFENWSSPSFKLTRLNFFICFSLFTHYRRITLYLLIWNYVGQCFSSNYASSTKSMRLLYFHVKLHLTSIARYLHTTLVASGPSHLLKKGANFTHIMFLFGNIYSDEKNCVFSYVYFVCLSNTREK